MEEETKIRNYKINISWKSGTIQTLDEAEEYLKKVIAQLKDEWLFKIEGEVK